MLVHLPCAIEQGTKDGHAQIQGDGQAIAAPQRIAPPHAIPDREDARLWNPHGHGRLPVAGECREVLADGCPVYALADQPGHGGPCVALGLGGGKALGIDEQQGVVGLQARPDRFPLGTIHIGHEMHPDMLIGQFRQGLAHQAWTEVRATDPDIDHIAQRLPGSTADLAVAHSGDKPLHVLEVVRDDTAPLRRDVLRSGPQHGVQRRAILGGIDHLACEQGPARAGQIHLMGQLQQVVPDGIVDEIARAVHEKAGRLE